MKLAVLNKFLSFLMLSTLIFVENIFSTPIDNRYDPVPFHTVFGMNKFYRKKKKYDISLNISPFYQSAAGARNNDGQKVPEGDLFGRWNMFALYWGEIDSREIVASTTTKRFDFQTIAHPPAPVKLDIPSNNTQLRYPGLSNVWRVLDNKSEKADPHPTDPDYDFNRTDLKYNYTNVDDFDVDIWYRYFPLTHIDYEKIGVRGQFNLDFGFGFGVNVKGGVVDYKQIATFEKTSVFKLALEQKDTDATLIYKYLMKPEILKNILKEVGLETQEVHETAMEDTHLQLYWSIPFDLKDNDEEVVVTFAPYLALGVWAPTGKKKDQDKAFSIPTGSDGYTGLTVDGALNFDFPRMVQLSFGAGVVVYGSDDRKGYRVPSSEYQMGIYPWKTDIRRRPGPVWYLNGSFMAKDFIENFSFYCDYVYAQHEKDSITIRDENKARGDAFLPTALEEESRWKTQTLNCGLNYSITPGLEIGISFQAHISGVRVYRTTTILGTITLNF